MKAKIKQIINGQDKPWNDKILRKRIIIFEDNTQGELTLWPDNEEPKEGQELDFEFNDRGFGQEIKLNKGGRSGGGGGMKKTPEVEAMINTIACLKSCIESKQLEPKHIEGFVTKYHAFFMDFAKSPAVLTAPELAKTPPIPTQADPQMEDDLPF